MKRLIYNIIPVLLSILSVTTCQSAKRNEYWHQRVSLFEKLPVKANHIVFLGNSITDGGEFNELFDRDDIVNRGIVGDVIDGVEERLYQVVEGHPKKLFLLIGINDVSHNLDVKTLAGRYERLVKKIRKESPETKVYLQSVMPINNDFKRYKNLIGKEDVIPAFNKEIERIAIDNGCLYIDLWPALSDPTTGKLKKEFTNDGLHLKGAGYKAWASLLKPYVEE